jgi:hypothetical protein
MGIFKKLFKRHDDVSLLDEPSYKPMSEEDLGLPELKSDPISHPTLDETDPTPEIPSFDQPQRAEQQHMQQYPQQHHPSSIQPTQTMQSSRDIDLILSKLDNIRSILNNLDIRLGNIERIAQSEKPPQKKYQW